MRRILFLCLMILPGMIALGEGYQINLQGARQIGMGHTGTGLNFGASSIHFNPGALGMMSGNFEVTAGASAIFSNNTFQKSGSVYTHKSDNPIGTPFFLYGAGKVNDRLVLGLGITTPFGNSLVWGDDWDGRYLIQDISLKAIYIQPTIAFKLSDNLSIGAGLVYAYGDVELHKALPVQGVTGDGQAELTGSTTAFGVNAGLFYQASPSLTFGLSYRSTVDMKMDEGKASFKVPASLATQFPETTFKSALPMPGGIQFGTGWQVTDRFLLAADLQYVLWSAYQELNFEFDAETVPDSRNVRNFENTLIYRIGAEYAMNGFVSGRAEIGRAHV